MNDPTPHARASLLPIFLIVIVDVFGLTLVLPLLAPYAVTLHATPLMATMLVSVYAACQLVSGPFLGQWSDRIGRKPVLIVSQIGTFIGFLVMARAHTLWVLYVARIIDGSTAGNISIAQAYISDNTEPKDRAKAFGKIGIAFGLGFFVGPTLSGYLAGHYGITAPIYFAAGISALSVLCTSTLLLGGIPPQHPDDNPGPGGRRLSVLSWSMYAKYFERPALRSLLFQFLFHMLCFSLFISGFALYAPMRFGWGPQQIGYLFGYVGFLAIMLQGGLIGRLVKRFGEMPLVTTGFLSLIVGYFFMGLAHTVWFLVVAATISSFGNSVLRPVLSSLITQRAGRHEQGVVIGLTQSLMSIASIIAPIIGGLLINRHMLTSWAWASAAFAAIGFAIALTQPTDAHETAARAA